MLQANGYWIPDVRSGAYFKRIDTSSLPQGCGNRVAVCRKVSGKEHWQTVVDGGAFVGSWTVHLARHAARVLAFEPMPDNFECLKRNLAHKGNVELHNAALTDSACMLHPIADHKNRSFSWRMRRDDSSAGPVRGVSIDSLALADVDLIKLDVEGHELQALQGARETIMRCRPIVVIEEKHEPERKATALLLSLGMQVRAQVKHDYIFSW